MTVCPRCHCHRDDARGHACTGQRWVDLWYFEVFFELAKPIVRPADPKIYRDYLGWRHFGYSRGDALTRLTRGRHSWTPSEVAAFARATVRPEELPGGHLNSLGLTPRHQRSNAS